ncbi:hypothetical protein [Dokdonia sp.]|uniref:hypothetical protein n=1 Tax=Dokdonia sp. TaxID=2024995 RepID=UPI003266018B
MKIQVPTTLSTKSNTEFRRLYKNQYGIDLNIQEANEEAYRLFSFFALVIENTPKYYE